MKSAGKPQSQTTSKNNSYPQQFSDSDKRNLFYTLFLNMRFFRQEIGHRKQNSIIKYLAQWAVQCLPTELQQKVKHVFSQIIQSLDAHIKISKTPKRRSLPGQKKIVVALDSSGDPITAYAEKFVKELRALKIDESRILVSGYKDRYGTPFNVLCRFTCNENGNIDIEVSEILGDSRNLSIYYIEKKEWGAKEYIHPFVSLKDIPRKEFFSQSGKAATRTIYELVKLRRSRFARPSIGLIIHILGPLGKYVQNPKTPNWKSPALGNNSLWRSSQVFLAKDLGKTEYKRFMFSLKENVFKHKQSFPGRRDFFVRGGQALMRVIASTTGSPQSNIENTYVKVESELNASSHQPIEKCGTYFLEFSQKACERKSFDRLKKNLICPASSKYTSSKYVIHWNRPLGTINAKNISVYFLAAEKFINAIYNQKNRSNEDLIFAIEKVALNLPVSKLEVVSSSMIIYRKQLEKSAEIIRDMGEKYFCAICEGDYKHHPCAIETIMTLYLWAFYITKQIHPSLFKGVCPNLELYRLASYTKAAKEIRNPQLFRRRGEMIRTVAKWGGQPIFKFFNRVYYNIAQDSILYERIIDNVLNLFEIEDYVKKMRNPAARKHFLDVFNNCNYCVGEGYKGDFSGMHSLPRQVLAATIGPFVSIRDKREQIDGKNKWTKEITKTGKGIFCTSVVSNCINLHSQPQAKSIFDVLNISSVLYAKQLAMLLQLVLQEGEEAKGNYKIVAPSVQQNLPGPLITTHLVGFPSYSDSMCNRNVGSAPDWPGRHITFRPLFIRVFSKGEGNFYRTYRFGESFPSIAKWKSDIPVPYHLSSNPYRQKITDFNTFSRRQSTDIRREEGVCKFHGIQISDEDKSLFRQRIPTENEFRVEKKRKVNASKELKKIPLPSRDLEYALIEWRLQTTSLFSYLKRHLDVIEKREMREYIRMALLKPVENYGGKPVENVPLFAEIKGEAVWKLLEAWVEAGLKKYYSVQAENSPKLDEILFLFEIYDICCACYKQKVSRPRKSFINTRDILEKIIEIKSLEGKKGRIHLAIVSSFMGKDLNKLSEEEWGVFYLNWIQVQNQQVQWYGKKAIACEDREYLIQVRKFVFQTERVFFDNCRKNKRLPTSVAQYILKRYNLENDVANLSWKAGKLSSLKATGQWEINLRKGEMIDGKGDSIVKGVLSPKEGEYQRLFGNEQIVCTRLGDETRFDSLYGEMKVINENYKDGLYRRSPETKQWQRYCSYKYLRGVIPLALIADYSHWFFGGEFHILHRETGKRAYDINRSGQIFTYPEKHKVHFGILSKKNDFLSDGLIEHPEYVLSIQAKRQKQIYPRYVSFEQSPLVLEKENGGKWCLNRDGQKFHLVAEKQEKLIPHMLVFSNLREGEGGRRALLPFCCDFVKAKDGQPYLAFGNISEEVFQEGSRRYLFIPFQGENFLCRTPVEKSFIAYLFLVRAKEKDYQRALRYLYNISFSERKSADFKNTLFSIFLHSDDSPGACSVRLYAFYLLNKIWSHKEVEDLGKLSIQMNLLSMYRMYRQGFRLACRDSLSELSTEIEKEIVEKIPGFYPRLTGRNAKMQSVRLFLKQRCLFQGEGIDSRIRVSSVVKSCLDWKSLKVPPEAWKSAQRPSKIQISEIEDSKVSLLGFNYLPNYFYYYYNFLKKGGEEAENLLFYLQRNPTPTPDERYFFYLLFYAYKAGKNALKIHESKLFEPDQDKKELKSSKRENTYFSQVKKNQSKLFRQEPNKEKKYLKLNKSCFSEIKSKADQFFQPIYNLSIDNVDDLNCDELDSLLEMGRTNIEDKLKSRKRKQSVYSRPLKPTARKRNVVLNVASLPKVKNPETCISKIQKSLPSISSPVKKSSPQPNFLLKAKTRYCKMHPKYERAIGNTIDHYQEEWKLGKSELEKPCTFKKGQLKEIKGDIDKGIKELTADLAKRTSDMQKAFESKDIHLKASRFVNGVGSFNPEELIKAFYRWGEEGLLRFNPALKKGQSKQAKLLINRYLHTKIEITHLKHILGKIEGYLKSKDPVAERGIHALLNLKRSENRENDFDLLVFEWTMGSCLRRDQVDVIESSVKALKDPSKAKGALDFIYQRTMGFGKSRWVFPRIVAFISLYTDKLPVYFCHYSQWASACQVVRDTQKKNFKDVLIIDYDYTQLQDPKISKKVIDLLREAREKNYCVLMKDNMLQLFEATFFSSGLDLKNYKKSFLEKDKKLYDRIRFLEKILEFFKDHVVAVKDEVDLLEDPFTGVNITYGARKRLDYEQTNLILQIYEFLRTEKDLAKKVGITKDKQANFSPHDYETVVLPKLIEKVAELPTLCLLNKHKKEFGRYVRNEINGEFKRKIKEKIPVEGETPQEKRDIEFLKYRQELEDSDVDEQVVGAVLINVAQEFLSSLLKVTLTRSFNQNFGKRKIETKTVDLANIRTISPFLGSRTEAKTDFQLIYAYLAYLASSYYVAGFSIKEFSDYASKLEKSAQDRVQYLNAGSVEKTVEANLFKRVTGYSFEQVKNPEIMEKARKRVNADPALRAKLALEMAIMQSYYFPNYVATNSMFVTNIIKSVVGGSGTLGNLSAFDKRLQQNVSLDKGADGRLIEILHRKSRANDLPIEETEEVSVKCFTDIIERHQDVRSIIDAGGLLRKVEMDDLVRGILGSENSRFKAVLHPYQDKNGKTRFGLALLRGKEIIRCPLEGTTEKDIKQLGYQLRDVFVIYDELRITGTHADQCSDTRAIVTLNYQKTTLRTFLQGWGRLRQGHLGQGGYVLAEKRKELSPLQFRQLLSRLMINQAIEVSQQEKRAVLMQITSIIRSVARERQMRLCKNPEKNLDEIIKYSKLFLTRGEIDPLRDFGLKEKIDDIIKVLELHKKRELKKYGFDKDKKVIGLVDNYINEIKQRITKPKSGQVTFLPNHEYVLASSEVNVSPDDKAQVNINVSSMQKINQQSQEKQREQERKRVLSELRKYAFRGDPVSCKEEPWNLVFVYDLNQLEKTGRFQSISQYMETYDNEKGFGANDRFSSCFAAWNGCQLYATDNFLNVIKNEKISLLDMGYRKQVWYFLVYQHNNLNKVVLVSKKDAAEFKKWMDNGYCSGQSGLFTIEGTHVAGTAIQEDYRKQALCLVNFYDGNVKFLQGSEFRAVFENLLFIAHTRSKQKWLMYVTAANGQWRFYTLQRDLVPRGLKGFKIPLEIQCSARFEETKKHTKGIQERNQNQVATVLLKHVRFLAKNQINWLAKPEQWRRVTSKQAPYVLPKHVNKLNETVAHDLKPNQIKALTNKAIIHALSSQQIQHLSIEGLKNLDKGQVLYVINEKLKHVQHLVQHFKEGQIPYVLPPYVNKLNPDQLKFISKEEQVKKLTRANRAHLGEKGVQHLSIKDVSAKQLPWIKDPKKLIDCHVNMRTHLNPEQWKILLSQKNLNEFIQEIPANKLQPNSFSLIFKYFSTKQILELGSARANHLSTTQWRALKDDSGTEAYIGKINNIEVLKNIPGSVRKHISIAKWKQLTREKKLIQSTPTNAFSEKKLDIVFPYLSASQVLNLDVKYADKITEAQWNAIWDSYRAQFESVEQYAFSEDNTQSMKDSMSSSLKKFELTSKYIAKINSPQALLNIPQALRGILSSGQWKTIAENNGSVFIKSTPVKVFAKNRDKINEVFQHLSVQQIVRLKPEYANKITEDQWTSFTSHKSLAKTYIPTIKDKKVIKSIPNIGLGDFLSEGQWKTLLGLKLSVSFFHKLSQDTGNMIFKFFTVTQILELGAQYADKVTPAQWKQMKPAPKIVGGQEIHKAKHQSPVKNPASRPPDHLPKINVYIAKINQPKTLLNIPQNLRGALSFTQWKTIGADSGGPTFIQSTLVQAFSSDANKVHAVFPHLSGSQIVKLDPKYADKITEAQWQELCNEKTYIQKINNQNVIGKIDSEFVPHLTTNQLAWLTQRTQWLVVTVKQAPKILPKHVNDLSPSVASVLIEKQVEALTSQSIIQKLSTNQIDWVAPQSINMLTPIQIEYVTKKTQVEKLTPANRAHLGEKGVQYLAIKEVTTKQLPWVKDVDKLINCPVENRVHLIKAQWEQLIQKKEIGQFVQKTPVNNLNPNILPIIFEYLSPTQIIKLGSTHASRLSLNQWKGVAKLPDGKAFIQNASISALLETIVVEIFSSLSIQQVLQLDAKYAEHITNDQWEELASHSGRKGYTQKIDDSKVINKLDPLFAEDLIEKQVKALTNQSIIQKLFTNQIAWVLPKYINHLIPAQIKHASREDQVDALNEEKYKFLGEKGVQYLAIADVTPNQLPWIKDVDKLINCPEKNRRYLTLEQWNILKDKKASGINNFIQDIPNSDLKKIKDLSIVFEYLSPKQIIGLGSTHAGDLSQQQWKEMEQAPGIGKYIAGITAPKHLLKIPGEMRKHITLEQWGQLNQTFIQATPVAAFSSEAKITEVFPHLTTQQVLDLGVGHVAKITQAQWTAIAQHNDYMEKIAVQDLSHVPAKLRHKLSLEQWKQSKDIDRLIPQSLQAFSGDVINYLFETSKKKRDVLSQIFAYNPTLLSQQNWKNILKEFPNQIAEIPVQFVEKIHPNLVPYFSKEQVQALATLEYLKKVTFDQMSWLSESQKRTIRKNLKTILNEDSSHHLFYLATPNDVSSLVKTNQKKITPPAAETRNIQEVIAGVVCLTVAALAAVWLSYRPRIRIGRALRITAPVIYAGAVATIAYRFFSHFGKAKDFEFVRDIPQSILGNSEEKAREILKKGPLPCYVKKGQAVPFIDVLKTGELKAGKIKKEASADGKMWSLSCTYTAPVHLYHGKSDSTYHAIETIRLSYDGKHVKGVSTRKIRQGRCDPTKNYPGLFR